MAWMIILPFRDFIIPNPEKLRRLQFPRWIKTTQADKEGIILSFDRSEFFRLSTGNFDIGTSNRPYFSARSNGSNWSAYVSAGTLATVIGSTCRFLVMPKYSPKQNILKWTA